MGGLASINVKFKVDLSGLSTEMQNAMRQIDKVGQRMQALGRNMSTFVTLPVLAAGGAATKMASDFEESMNKVNVAFENSSDSVKSFSKESLKNFGIAEGTALDMAAGFGDMATSMGLTRPAAAKMSTSLVGLAGDLASFKNIGVDQAMTALNGVFTGETESLKRLGIVMTEANLQAFALSKGIKTQIKDMDQASKVNLRYAYIMENTSNAQGDFARTGGGAANQTRIFFERLKQIGQQFGSIILPLFTKAVTYVNNLFTGFSELSEGTKKTIVVIAGLVAAIGPLLTAVGAVLSFVPLLVVKVKDLAAAFLSLQKLIVANPYVALASAIALVAVGMYTWYQNQKQVVTSQQALVEAMKKGDQAATSEVATLDKLYSAATNVKLSTNERKKAVDELQKLYPAYFDNIKNEVILNGKASDSYKQLRDDIFNKARAIAVDQEIQKRANERVEKEIELRNNIAKTEKEISRLRAGANEIVIQEASAAEKTMRVTASKADLIKAQTEMLRIQNKELADFNAQARKEDEVLFAAKEEFSKKSGKLSENEILLQKQIALGITGIKDATEGALPGTVAFYEEQISALKKLQEEQATSNEQWLNYQKTIEGLQQKIDNLKGVRELVESFDLSVISNSSGTSAEQLKIKEYELLIEKLKELQKMQVEGSAKWLEYEGQIKKSSDAINEIKLSVGFDVMPIEVLDEKLKSLKDSSVKTLTAFQEASKGFGETMTSALEATTESLVSGFASMLGSLASGGLSVRSFFSFILGTIGDLMQQLGKAAIQIGVTMKSIKESFSKPVFAIVSGIALIALGGLIKSFVPKEFQGFQDGGIVGGTSYYGDKILARVNSKELILNQKQQSKVWGMIDSVGATPIVLSGGFEVTGDKLQLVLDRSNKRKNRLG